MNVTSAPIGQTGQSLDGFAVAGNVPSAFRESVVITDPTDAAAIAPVTSTFGLSVNVMSTVAQAVTVNVTTLASTQIISSIPFYVAQSSAPWTVNGGIQVSSSVATSTQIVSSIPFYVVQSSSPWTMNGGVTVSTQLPGTSQIFGGVSSQTVSSLPVWVSQSSAPWSIIGAVSVSSQAAVSSSWPLSTTQVFGTVSTNVVSSIPFFVVQSSAPWTFNGGINVSSQAAVSSSWPLNTTQVFGSVSSQIVSSVPFYVSQSSAPWVVVNTVSTTGGTKCTSIVCLAGLNTTVIKAGAGMLYGYSVSNFGSSKSFLKLCNNSTAAVVSTAILQHTVGCPSSTSVNNTFPLGMMYSTGIVMYTIIDPFSAGGGTTGVLSSTMTVSLCFI